MGNRKGKIMDKQELTLRLNEFIVNESRSCSMDVGGITPLYVYRMWNGSVPLEEIETAMAGIKFPER